MHFLRKFVLGDAGSYLYHYDMAKKKEREEAQRMRSRGTSITEIASSLGVSKSTTSYWCRDIPLTDAQRASLARSSLHAGVHAFRVLAEQKRTLRQARVKEALASGAADVKTLSERDLFMLGLGLYWGEGYKYGNDECGFTNSDPRIIRFYLEWLTRIFEVKKEDLILRVSINDLHEERERAVLGYWSRLTGVPASQFTKTSFIRSVSRVRFANHESHFGTLRVKVRRGSALRLRILGAIDHIAELS